jgi:FAD/FMN-containing dehydrogenase
MDTLIETLKKSFKGEIAVDDASLTKYSRDASLFVVRPQVIVFPKDSADLKILVTEVAKAKASGMNISMTARSAGTDMSGGPLTESIVVDFTKYFNKIIEIGADYAITQPGVYYRDFEKETLKKNLLMPSYPASRELCTVGGMVANNSGGEKTLLYGKVLDYVDEIKVILRDGEEYVVKPLNASELLAKKALQTVEGELYRSLSSLIDANYDVLKKAKPQVSKNSAGYYLWEVFNKETGIFNLAKVIVGSQGTLCFVTEIKYRLITPRTHSRLLVVFLKDMKELGHITNHLLQFKPESLESYDDHTFKLAVKLFPLMLKRMKGNVFSLMFKFLPEFWAVLTGGIPKLLLMAEFTAIDDAGALQLATDAQKSLEEFHIPSRITQSPQEVEKYWTIRRESFRMLREHIKNLRTAPFIDDFVVKPEFLPEFLPKLYNILDKYPITYTVAGHVGDGNFHIIPLMDMNDPKSVEYIGELAHTVNTLIFQYKGSMTGEHNDGIIRTPFLEQMYGHEIVALFAETKKIFDPAGIFNPGKKVGGTWEYAMAHLDVPKKVVSR